MDKEILLQQRTAKIIGEYKFLIMKFSIWKKMNFKKKHRYAQLTINLVQSNNFSMKVSIDVLVVRIVSIETSRQDELINKNRTKVGLLKYSVRLDRVKC